MRSTDSLNTIQIKKFHFLNKIYKAKDIDHGARGPHFSEREAGTFFLIGKKQMLKSKKKV